MLSDLVYRIRALLRRKSVESELEDELQFHMDRQVDKLRTSGLSDQEARRQARISLGGHEQIKEKCRDARGVALLESFFQDLTYALRVLRKSPGFTASVTLSLALGIGANTAIFTLLDAILWRMLPITRPAELVLLTHGQGTSFEDGFTFQQFRTMREKNQVMSGLAAWSPVPLNISWNGASEPTASGQLVTGNFFSVLGVQAVAGRAINEGDDQIPNTQPVAMLSHAYWKRRFGLDPAAIGRTVTLSGVPFTVIGVAPPEFFGVETGAAPDLFVPIGMQPAVTPSAENLLLQPGQYLTWVRAIGRMNPGVGLAQASSELESLFRQEIPKGGKFSSLAKERLVLVHAANGVSGLRREFSQPLFVLMAFVALVLLIACANTATLLVARSAARQPELAMRMALGASSGRLIRQLLVESVALAALGGIIGVVLAQWATRMLVVFLSSGRTPVVLDLQPNWRILGFTVSVSIVTGIVFGLMPALRATRSAAAAAIKNASGTLQNNTGGSWHGRALAVVQVAFALVLITGAGLLVRSLQNVSGRNAGLARESVLIVRVEPKGSDQRNAPGVPLRLDRTYRELIQRVQAFPGVRSASMAQFTPATPRGAYARFTSRSGEERRAFLPMVYPRYFETMGIAMLAGRDFNNIDLSPDAPLTAIVNETLARTAFPNETPVGQRLLVEGELREIVGLVKDSSYTNPRGEVPPTIYQTFLQTRTGRGQMALHVRTSGDPGGVLPSLREAVQAIDRQLPVFEVQTLAQEMDAVLIRERLLATLSTLFGILALILASVGMYGLFAFAVVQRTREIGIRMALGACRTAMVWSILREVFLLALVGISAGIPVALAAVKVTSAHVPGLLYGLKPYDPLTLAATIALLAAAALIAGLVPSLKASRVDPIAALRNE